MDNRYQPRFEFNLAVLSSSEGVIDLFSSETYKQRLKNRVSCLRIRPLKFVVLKPSL